MAPENTLKAFALAIREGADGIEMDVRLAAGGVPVVFHDATLKRVAGTDQRVSSLKPSELKRVDVGSWFNSRNQKQADRKYVKTGVPTLEDVLAGLREYKGVIYVELKCSANDAEETAKSVAGILASSDLLPQMVVKSFDLDTIPIVKARCPGLKTAALFAPKVLSVIRKETRLVSIAKDLGADGLSLHSSLVTRKLMKKAGRAGLGVAVWTVDSPRWVKRALELGVGALITNKPAKMLLRRRELLHRNSITA